MKHHQFRSFTCFLLLFSTIAFAQKKPFASLQEALSSGGLMNGGSGPRSVNWINGGENFSFLPSKPNTISTYDPKTDKEEVTFSTEGLKFPDSDKAFTYNSFQWSNDFKYLVFQTNFRPVWRYSGNADYYLYSLEDKSLRLVAKDAYTAQLSPDGKKVAYERKGNLFVFDLASKKETQLTNDAQTSLYNGRFGWVYEEEFGLVQAWAWSPDSQYIAFWQSDERNVPVYQMTDFQGLHPEYEKIPYPRVGDPNVIVKVGIINLATKKKNWVNIPLNDGYIPRIYWTSKTGQLALVHLNRKQNNMTLYFADAKTGAARKIMEEESKTGWIDVYDFFANNAEYFKFPQGIEEFYWISGRDDFHHIYRYDYSGKLLNQVTKGSWDVASLEGVDIKTKKIYYISTEKSALERHLYSVDFEGNNRQRLTQADGRHRINFSSGNQYFIDTYSNLSTPKQVELWSTEGKKIKTFEDNAKVKDFVANHTYATRELSSIITTDGQKLDVYITKPQNFDASKKYPLVLTIYGGPGSQSVYNEWAANGWEQYLSQEGYVVASVNNRGCSGYGQKFMEIVYEKLGEYESKDFVETAKALAKTYTWIDEANMAIQGHSYGGYMSSYTMVKHPEIFKAAIVGAPVTDYRLYDNIYTERYMGLLPENEKKYQETVLANYAKNLKGKVLLAHSTMDDNVHVVNTFQLVKAFVDAGKDIDLRIFPPGNHSVSYSFQSYLLLQTTYLDFLNRHLKNK